ncbi:MAG: hypothetical protein WAN65_23350, partial [Candidatus Sulfotelmatobacter sp.]
MAGRCPLCGQSLPEAISKTKLQAGLQKLSLPLVTAERKKLKDDFEDRLTASRTEARQKAEREVARELRAARGRALRAEQAAERHSKQLEKEYSDRFAKEAAKARREAESNVRKQLLDTEKRATIAEERGRKEVEQARRTFDSRVRKEVADAVRIAVRENEGELDKIQAEREREKLRHETEKARLQGKLEDLSRKMDKQSGEELGSEAERDLLLELQNAFQRDDIRRIGRGVMGADILHAIKHEDKIVGRIIYESKNTGNWGKAFISQAKKYQSQYETTHVMIVTRTFPPKRKGFCVE